ncbi:hypothetical protein LCGC14_2994050, partial [marine sediment metagenome]
KECLRVLKPGGTALIFAGSRTQHRMAVNVEDAGFILKDCIMWLYGSGFPKATDISKQLDKMAGVEHPSEEAKLWNGWKSHGLKPAYEPILVAMKPNEGTYAQNALKHGVAGLNIDGGRIPHNENLSVKRDGHKLDTNKQGWGFKAVSRDNKGRFPANIILDEEAGRMLDKQSGISKSSGGSGEKSMGGLGKSKYGKYALDIKATHIGGLGDKGGASRFFYCAKASKAERNKGCEELEYKDPAVVTDFRPTIKSHPENWKNLPSETPYARGEPAKNNHPTVKPLKLMEYLCILTKTPTGGIVLDPFMGSGTTGIACKMTDRKFIGIEMKEEYMKIAVARIKAYKKED